MKSSSRSFKWIFFRIVNYIHIVVGLFIIVLSFIGNWPLRFEDFASFLGFLFALLVFIIFIGNGLSNLYLLEKHFPDQLPSKSASSFNLVLHILQIIISSLMIVILIIGLFSRYESEPGDGAFPLITLVFFSVFGVTSIPLWILQGNLRSTLKRNYYTTFDQFLENDDFPQGETE